MKAREGLEPHPLAKIYAAAEETYRAVEAELAVARRELEVVEERLSRLQVELARLYGPGYLTVKTVGNRRGKRYRYPVWRGMDRRDRYLKGDPRAHEILGLKERQRLLRARINKLKRIARYAYAHMQATREYKDTCIDQETGEYLDCPQGVL